MAEWNINGLIEYQILQVLEIVSMCDNAYIAKKVPPTSTTNNLIIGFMGQLKNWWFNYLIEIERYEIAIAVHKKGENDRFSTLVCNIIKHFIGVPTDVMDRQSEILMNLNCPKIEDFHWYKDIFLTRALLCEDCDQSYQKERFLPRLPILFAKRARNAIKRDNDNTIPYQNITYGELINFDSKKD